MDLSDPFVGPRGSEVKLASMHRLHSLRGRGFEEVRSQDWRGLEGVALALAANDHGFNDKAGPA